MTQKTFNWLWLAGVAFAALATISCASSSSAAMTAVPSEVWLKEENNGQRVQLRASQLLGINLEGNPGTGYSWQVATINSGILQQVGEIEFKSDSTMPGAPARMLLRFKVVGKGEGELKLNYVRPWEKDQSPVKTFSVTVVTQ